MCSLGASPGVHYQVRGVAFPSCSLSMSISVLSRSLRLLFHASWLDVWLGVYLLCCALLKLDLHGRPRERRTVRKKGKRDLLHPLRITFSVKEEEVFPSQECWLMSFPITGHHHHHHYYMAVWELIVREQRVKRRNTTEKRTSTFFLLGVPFPTSRAKMSRPIWSPVCHLEPIFSLFQATAQAFGEGAGR